MPQPFKVGDIVRPVRPAENTHPVVKWVDDMDEFVGQLGVVETVELIRGADIYTVRMSPDDLDVFYFLPAWLSAESPTPPVDVGDFVHFRRPNTLPFDPPGRGRVIGVGERKLAVWPDFYSASEPWFIDRDWVVLEDSAATQTA